MNYEAALKVVRKHQANPRTVTPWPQVAYATWLVLIEETEGSADPVVVLKHHQTYIAEWYSDGMFVVLMKHKYRTVTTMRKLNQFCPEGMIFSRSGKDENARFWYRLDGMVWFELMDDPSFAKFLYNHKTMRWEKK